MVCVASVASGPGVPLTTCWQPARTSARKFGERLKERGLSERNIQGRALYQEVEGVYRALRQPGTGHISDIADLNVAPTVNG